MLCIKEGEPMAELYEQGNIRTGDGLDLFFCRNIPNRPRGIVVFLHSVAEHSGRYREVAAGLKEAGYGVYRFDCRGHGRSDGARGDVQGFLDYVCDADLVVERARAHFPGLPVFLAGHSMGALVAVAYAVLHPGKLRGEITAGAAVRLPPALGFLNGGTNRRERGDERFSMVMPYWKAGEDGSWQDDGLMLDSVTVRLAGNVWLYGADWFRARAGEVETPLFILHGEEDSFVPPEYSRWLYDSVGSKDRTLRLYPRRGHRLLNERDDVLQDVIGWLDRRTAPVARAVP